MDPVRFGKYFLESRMGVGGMAEVFKARLSGPQGFEKHLAVKLILPSFSENDEFVSMFIHEATLAARLDHANIVRIHEFDSIDGRYYIAMELVDGRDLGKVLKRCAELDTRLTVPEVALIGVEICRALAFAHGELTSNPDLVVIHRDVSPQNVLLSRAGEVKLSDFGIAKLEAASTVTQTGTVKGKFAYMSPEQASGDQLDRRTDVFSLGCVLWELLNQKRLFAGRSDIDTLERLKSAEIQPPSYNNPDVGPEMDRLVLSALERDRQLRTPSASEVGRQLEQVLEGFSGLERARVLPRLYDRLFAGMSAITGTSRLSLDEEVRMPATVGALPGAAPARREATPAGEVSASSEPSLLLIDVVEDQNDPSGVEKVAGRQEPIPAEVDSKPEDSKREERTSGPSRRWWLSAAAALAVLSAAGGLVYALSSGPGAGSQGPVAAIRAGEDSVDTPDPKARQDDGKVVEAARAADPVALAEPSGPGEIGGQLEHPIERLVRKENSSRRDAPKKVGLRQKNSRPLASVDAEKASKATADGKPKIPVRGAGFYKAGVTMKQDPAAPKLSPGTVVKVKLAQEISSDSCREVKASVAQDVRSQSGQLLLAAGAVLSGKCGVEGQAFVLKFTAATTGKSKESFSGSARLAGPARAGDVIEVRVGEQ